jgi:hypothetical protein
MVGATPQPTANEKQKKKVRGQKIGRKGISFLQLAATARK